MPENCVGRIVSLLNVFQPSWPVGHSAFSHSWLYPVIIVHWTGAFCMKIESLICATCMLRCGSIVSIWNHPAEFCHLNSYHRHSNNKMHKVQANVLQMQTTSRLHEIAKTTIGDNISMTLPPKCKWTEVVSTLYFFARWWNLLGNPAYPHMSFLVKKIGW